MEEKTIPVKNIEESINVLEEAREYADLSIAWVDAFSTGCSALGRGYVSTGKWVDKPLRIDYGRLSDSLTSTTRIFGILPSGPTWFMARPFFKPKYIKMANTLNYLAMIRKNKNSRSKKHLMLFPEYNFMHNKIPDFNHAFRPYGYIEFQFLFPKKHGLKAITDILKLCHSYSFQSLVCAIKVHKKDDYMISFSEDGYSFNVDLQMRGRDIEDVRRFGRRLLEKGLEYDGRVHLAKDELLPHDIFQKMYPRYKEFLEVKAQVDPLELFQSDMYRRLLKPEAKGYLLF